jgi:hypothetical protein
MNVCLFVFPLSNYILCAMDRKLDVKSKMSFFPASLFFFFPFFWGGGYVRDPVWIFSSQTIVYGEQECFPVLFFIVSKRFCLSFG